MLNEDHVRKNLQKSWEVEAIGIPSEEEEDIVMETFENNIYFSGSHYVTKLPFKEGCESVPDNYRLCVGRLHSLWKRLMANPKLLKDYSDIIDGTEHCGGGNRRRTTQQDSIFASPGCAM